MEFKIFNDRVASPVAPGRVRRISSTIDEMMALHSAPPTSDPIMFDDEDNMALDDVDVLCDSRRDVHDVKSVISVDPSLNSLGDIKYTDVSDHSRSDVSSSSGASPDASESSESSE